MKNNKRWKLFKLALVFLISLQKSNTGIWEFYNINSGNPEILREIIFEIFKLNALIFVTIDHFEN